MSISIPSQFTQLQDAIAAARSGDKIAAHELLEQITAAEPENELAWLWRASVSTTLPEVMQCWRRVLKINPQQEQAALGLRRLLLQEGVAAAKQGRKEEARALLLELTELDTNNEIAWLWLATLAENVEEAARHTARVLQINPHNERAQAWMHKLQPAAAPPALASTVSNAVPADVKILSSSTWNCPLCGYEAIWAATRCSHCHAIVSLTSLDEVLDNQDVNLPLVREAVQRLEEKLKVAGEDADHLLLFNLGLGYLNLGRFEEGAKCLRRASELKLKDTWLKAQVECLLEKVAQSAFAANVDVQAATSLELTASEAERAMEPSGGYTILVVDDSPTIRKFVSMTLEKYGHQVTCANNGLDALGKLKEVVPDLILSDITMPHMDGYQLCKMIRGNMVTKDVPIIMLSGKDGIFDKLRGRMVGATAYITKPFEIDSLLQLIDMHCQQAAARA